VPGIDQGHLVLPVSGAWYRRRDGSDTLLVDLVCSSTFLAGLLECRKSFAERPCCLILR